MICAFSDDWESTWNHYILKNDLETSDSGNSPKMNRPRLFMTSSWGGVGWGCGEKEKGRDRSRVRMRVVFFSMRRKWSALTFVTMKTGKHIHNNVTQRAKRPSLMLHAYGNTQGSQEAWTPVPLKTGSMISRLILNLPFSQSPHLRNEHEKSLSTLRVFFVWLKHEVDMK